MRNLEHYLALPYEVTVTPDECTDGSTCYVARIIELPGCESHGATPEEALENLQEAKGLFISSMLEDGLPVPEPAALTDGTYKGKTSIWRFVVSSCPPRDLPPTLIGAPTMAAGLGG